MKSKSFHLFSSLSPSEKMLLIKFVEMESFSRTSEFIDLLKFYDVASVKQLEFDKESMFKSVFPNKTFSDSKLRLLQSGLTKALERFIVYLSLSENNDYHKNELLKHLKSRKLNSLYEKQLRKYKGELKLPQRIHFKGENFFIAEEMYENAIQNREEGKEVTQQLLDKLDYQYILKKLRYSCLVRSQENVYSIDFDHGLISELLDFIGRRQLYKDPAIGTYYYCFRMLAAESKTKDFDLFYEYLQKYDDQFSEEVSAELYTLAINFCIRSLNQGNRSFGLMGLKFYTDGIDKGILLTNGQVSRFTFRNIVTMAIRINEFQRAESFIESYQHLLSKTDKQNMIHFTTALVLFSRKDYELASDELLKVRFKDLLFNLAAKGLQLKIYYETKEFLVLQSHLDAMQIFLKRHEALGYHKQNYLNAIAFTRKLMNARSMEKVVKLRSIIDGEKTLTERIWFQDKVDELMARF